MPENTIQAAPQAAVQGDQVRDQDKIMLVLAYFSILCLIPFLTVKDSDYVKFHARQGLALFLCWVGCALLSCLLTVVGIGAILMPLIGLGAMVLSIVAIIKAFKPERWRIPVVASVADMLGK
jgi:fumarate reductase subunit D